MIPLEDTHLDVLAKAQRGLRLEDDALTGVAGVRQEQLDAVRHGLVDGPVLRALSKPLGLNAGALLALARGGLQPERLEVAGLARFNTVFGEMTVNAYLAWDAASGRAVAFDTGADCSPMLELLAHRGLTLELILLTHTHGDHVIELDRLMEKTGAPAFVGEREPLEGATPFAAGRTFQAGALRIATRLTWGHSPGGVTYVVSGLERPVAVVGDSLFAGSMGGGNVSYEAALECNRSQILTLPEETVLCPGHGPLTTVGAEKRHNPFFA